MKKIKAIFWDNDGVLVDTERLYFKANQAVLKKHGIDITEEIYLENFLKRSHGTWHLLRDKNYSEEQIELIRKERNEFYSTLLSEQSHAIDGAEAALKCLHGKYLMAIVTSSRRDHFDAIHKSTEFKKYFDFIITSDDVAETKPSPLPYLKALELSGLDKNECVIVEDSERGLKSALAAGIKCFIIPTALTKNSNFTGAEKILSNIDELKVLLADSK